MPRKVLQRTVTGVTTIGYVSKEYPKRVRFSRINFFVFIHEGAKILINALPVSLLFGMRDQACRQDTDGPLSVLLCRVYKDRHARTVINIDKKRK